MLNRINQQSNMKVCFYRLFETGSDLKAPRKDIDYEMYCDINDDNLPVDVAA